MQTSPQERMSKARPARSRRRGQPTPENSAESGDFPVLLNLPDLSIPAAEAPRQPARPDTDEEEEKPETDSPASRASTRATSAASGEVRSEAARAEPDKARARASEGQGRGAPGATRRAREERRHRRKAQETTTGISSLIGKGIGAVVLVLLVGVVWMLLSGGPDEPDSPEAAPDVAFGDPIDAPYESTLPAQEAHDGAGTPEPRAPEMPAGSADMAVGSGESETDLHQGDFAPPVPEPASSAADNDHGSPDPIAATDETTDSQGVAQTPPYAGQVGTDQFQPNRYQDGNAYQPADEPYGDRYGGNVPADGNPGQQPPSHSGTTAQSQPPASPYSYPTTNTVPYSYELQLPHQPSGPQLRTSMRPPSGYDAGGASSLGEPTYQPNYSSPEVRPRNERIGSGVY